LASYLLLVISALQQSVVRNLHTYAEAPR